MGWRQLGEAAGLLRERFGGAKGSAGGRAVKVQKSDRLLYQACGVWVRLYTSQEFSIGKLKSVGNSRKSGNFSFV